MRRALRRLALVVPIGLLPGGIRAEPAVRGIDHVPVAVQDLEAAATRYRDLGFTLKPGRPHGNGIQNRHVKFPDGTELELITAPSAVDALTGRYRRHLAAGDGPAFVALYAPDLDRVARLLDEAGHPGRRGATMLTFPEADPLSYLFFGGRNRSPTDRPEHFAHPNGAVALIGVWLAGDDLQAERDLLASVGATLQETAVERPGGWGAIAARLPEGDVLLLPGDAQVLDGRRIAGATVQVRDLDVARRSLVAFAAEVLEGEGGLFLPPSVALGLWLELRESRRSPP